MPAEKRGRAARLPILVALSLGSRERLAAAQTSAPASGVNPASAAGVAERDEQRTGLYRQGVELASVARWADARERFQRGGGGGVAVRGVWQ